MDKDHPGIENLQPFKPGQSGNPKGREKGSKNRSTIYREILESGALKKYIDDHTELLGADVPKLDTIAEQMAFAQVIKGMTGDTQATKEAFDSAYGKIVDKSEQIHSFTQMGRIKAETINAPKDPTTGQPQAVTLTFDIGEDVPMPEEQPE